MSDFNEVVLNVRKKELVCLQGKVKISKLKFYKENPRIYSQYNKEDFEYLTTEQIQSKMILLDHVKKLKASILENGGVIEPLIVRKEDMTVLDGNSRLAALRALNTSNPIKWAEVNVILLPEGVDKKDVSAILGVYHIVGRKDWSPYEQAGYLYRLQFEDEHTSEEISEILGIQESEVKKYISVYKLMIENNDEVSSKWSYYNEYNTLRAIKNMIKAQPKAESIILEKIRNNQFDKAEDLRDFSKIMNVTGKGDRNKLIKEFIQDPDSFYDIVDEAEDKGGANSLIKSFEKFNKKLMNKNSVVNEYMKMNKQQKQKFKYVVKKMKENIADIKKECT